MNFFKNIKLFWKFSIFGGIVTLLLVILLLISYNGLKGTDARADRHQGIAKRLYMINAQGLQTEQAIRNIVLNPGDEKAFANYKIKRLMPICGNCWMRPVGLRRA